MRARARPWRLAVRLAAVLVLAPLPPVLYLSHFGFPKTVTDKLVNAATSKGYCLEMTKMRLDIFEGIVIDSPRLYEKGVVGPPLFEAGEIAVGLRLIGATGSGRIQGITIKNGKLRLKTSDRTGSSRTPSGSAEFPTLNCRIVLENCELHHLPLSSMSCNVVARGSKLQVFNVAAGIGRGERIGHISGDVSYNASTGRFTGRTTSDLDPNTLLQFLAAHRMNGIVSLITSFEFPDCPPLAQTCFNGCAGTTFAIAVDGNVKARRFRRYGLDVRQADSQVRVVLDGDRQFVALCPLAVVHNDSIANVDLTINLWDNTVSFIGSGNADPRAVMQAIAPATAGLLDDYHIGGPARYSTKGFLNITNLDICDIEVIAEAKSFGLPHIVADECAFTFRRTGHSMVVSNLQASVFGGTMAGNLAFSPDIGSTNTRFRAGIAVEKVSFRDLAQALTSDNTIGEGLVGEVSGRLTAEGLLGKGQEHTINGAGDVTIRHAHLFQLPLFGQLSELLSRKVPGLGYVLRQNVARAPFSIAQGRLTTDQLYIEGDILSLKADGSYDIPTDQLDFDVELRFLRNKTWVGEILQTIMLPVTKMFRVRLRGSLNDPRWSSVNF